jgi:hypothetical protein
MKRDVGGIGRGARGRGTKRIPPRSGGAGAPPGDTTTPREELADGGGLLALAESAARLP